MMKVEVSDDNKTFKEIGKLTFTDDEILRKVILLKIYRLKMLILSDVILNLHWKLQGIVQIIMFARDKRLKFILMK